jgi:S1-C subfamily serine protease
LDNRSGVRVAGLDADGPAARAGLALGDIIIAIEGRAVAGVDDLVRLLTDERVGRATEVALLRGVELKRLSVLPVERRS